MDRDSKPKFFTPRCGPTEPGQGTCYDPFGHERFKGRKGWTPNTDIVETEEGVQIIMDISGVDKDNIKVVHRGDILHVSGLRTRKKLPGVKRFHRMEIDYGPFEKMFHVPSDLDVENARVDYETGFLLLFLPKKQTAEPKRIVIVYEEV